MKLITLTVACMALIILLKFQNFSYLIFVTFIFFVTASDLQLKLICIVLKYLELCIIQLYIFKVKGIFIMSTANQQ